MNCFRIILPALLLAVGGCAPKKGSELQSSAGTAPGTDSDTVITAIDPATTGSIGGTVYLDGPAPVFPSIDMRSEPACSQSASPTGSATPVMASGNGELANAVVYVKDGLGRHYFNPPKDAVALDQRGCVYEPRVVALMVNQTLAIHNSDPTIHNVHAMPRHSGEWNKAQRAGRELLTTSFSKPELAIPFMCNVHPWMRAFVFVFDHPYYSITTGAGKFNLPNLPPGTYTIEVWQEKLGTLSQTVTIAPQESEEISFRFALDRPAR